MSGLCSASATKNPTPVICCPQRLYANDYEILKRISREAFGADIPLLTDDAALLPEQGAAIPFGQRLGKELKVHSRGSNYSFDWIIALVDKTGALVEFVAVEVQTIDTTGSYRSQSWELQKEHDGPGIEGYERPLAGKSSNFNFENVNKRILPQLITKGHLLRVEESCKKGLFFVCPTPVLERIYRRLGNQLAEYALQPGRLPFTITPSIRLPLSVPTRSCLAQDSPRRMINWPWLFHRLRICRQRTRIPKWWRQLSANG